jgi:Polysaccharide lyase
MLQTGSICPMVPPGDYELSGLPPTTPLPSGVTALTDWTQHPAHGGWYAAQEMDDCRYQADPGGFQTWHGKLSARLEVNPGDDPLQLGENSERTECLTEQGANGNQISEGPASGKQYYATSYYFSSAWAATFYPYSVFEAGGSSWPGNVSGDCGGAGNLCNSWSLVLQFHQPGGGEPWAVLAAGSAAPGQPQKMWLTGSQDAQFSDGGQIVSGAWVDLVLEVDWTSGAITIWRRNQGQTGFNQVVAATFPAPADGTYMKQGLYRGGNVNGRTDVLWVGPTARGSTFAAVEQAAFGTNAGP